jgi:hypothetical protein
MRSPCRTCRYDQNRSTCHETCIALREYQEWLDAHDLGGVHEEQVRRAHALAWCILKPLLRAARP